jgi:hypothetical protein
MKLCVCSQIDGNGGHHVKQSKLCSETHRFPGFPLYVEERSK